MTEGTSTGEELVIERLVHAPVEIVWRMWTDAHDFAEWYGPAGVTIPVATMDVKVGGERRIAMETQTPSGPMRMWFAGEYLEIVQHRRLVYTEAMTDESGAILAPGQLGMPDDLPAVTEITVELEDLGGRTRMRLTHRGIPGDSPGATGWMLALDKLEAIVNAQT